MVNPCYQCSERKLHCHSQCSKYQQWKSECDQLKDANKSIKKAFYEITDNRLIKIAQANKHKRK